MNPEINFIRALDSAIDTLKTLPLSEAGTPGSAVARQALDKAGVITQLEQMRRAACEAFACTDLA